MNVRVDRSLSRGLRRQLNERAQPKVPISELIPENTYEKRSSVLRQLEKAARVSYGRNLLSSIRDKHGVAIIYLRSADNDLYLLMDVVKRKTLGVYCATLLKVSRHAVNRLHERLGTFDTDIVYNELRGALKAFGNKSVRMLDRFGRRVKENEGVIRTKNGVLSIRYDVENRHLVATTWLHYDDLSYFQRQEMKKFEAEKPGDLALGLKALDLAGRREIVV